MRVRMFLAAGLVVIAACFCRNSTACIYPASHQFECTDGSCKQKVIIKDCDGGDGNPQYCYSDWTIVTCCGTDYSSAGSCGICDTYPCGAPVGALKAVGQTACVGAPSPVPALNAAPLAKPDGAPVASEQGDSNGHQ